MTTGRRRSANEPGRSGQPADRTDVRRLLRGLPETGTNWQHYYHNGALYSDPRISAYIGMGLRQMPGDVWWRTWRTLPPKAPSQCQATDPDFSWQGQWPVPGYWPVYRDPQSGKPSTCGKATTTYYGGRSGFIPTCGGGMFEGLMPNLVVPETAWGPRSFGLADVRSVQVQIKYATEALHITRSGACRPPAPPMTPVTTAASAPRAWSAARGEQRACPSARLRQRGRGHAERLVHRPGCPPQQAYANIQNLRQLYPASTGTRWLLRRRKPDDGRVGHRYLVLDESMIMAALDNAPRTMRCRGISRRTYPGPQTSTCPTRGCRLPATRATKRRTSNSRTGETGGGSGRVPLPASTGSVGSAGAVTRSRPPLPKRFRRRAAFGPRVGEGR